VAGLECRSLHRDAHLVVIDNVQEQAAVAGMLASIASTSVSHFLVWVTGSPQFQTPTTLEPYLVCECPQILPDDP